MAEYSCNSAECDGRIFDSREGTARCIYCGSEDIRRLDKPWRRPLILIVLFVLIGGGSGWYGLYLDDTGRESLHSVFGTGCKDLTACNYLQAPIFEDKDLCEYKKDFRGCQGLCINDMDGDDVCDEQEIEGCIDEAACNFDELATEARDICEFPELGFTCSGDCVNDRDGDGICDEDEVLGCTDPEACNFDAVATEPDGSCWYREVGKSCEDLSELYEKRDAYFVNGLIRYVVDDFQGAVVYLSEAIKIDPDNASYFYERGYSYSQIPEYLRAYDDFSKAIELKSDYAEAHMKRAGVCFFLERFEDSIADAEIVIGLDSTSAQAHGTRGVGNFMLKNYDEAFADFTRAIDIEPENSRFYFNRGKIQIDRKLLDRAYDDFSNSVLIEPDYTEAHYEMGKINALIGKYQESVRDYDHAIQSDSTNSIAFWGRALSKRNVGDLTYCSDFKMACELGIEDCCLAYAEECDVK